MENKKILISLMSDLIQKIQNLQRLNSSDISLPTIVCIGPQSCGKTSVIEQLLQLEILPKGKNLVTKCPIIINMIKSDEEYVKVGNRIFKTVDVKKIKKCIEEEMDNRVRCDMVKELKENIRNDSMKDVNEDSESDISGNSSNECINDDIEIYKQIPKRIKSISKESVTITYSSKNNINLTLIDLPGLIKIPLKSQPSNLKELVEEMVFNCIKNERTIILAVINAAVDISNSESLEMAMKVDPNGRRTIGVLTKIDLMDKGTNCIKILNNEYIKLRYGYAGLVNRGELTAKKTLEEGLKNEEDFFSNRIYKNIKNKGSTYLRNYLSEILYNNIKSTLPTIKNELNEKLKYLQRKKSSIVEMDAFYIVNKFLEIVMELLEEKNKKYYKNEENILERNFNRFSHNNIENNINTFYYNTIENNLNNLLYFSIENTITLEYFKDNTLFISDNIFIYNIQKNIRRKSIEIENRINEIFKLIKYKLNNIITTLNHTILSTLLNTLENILYERMNIFKSNMNLFCEIESIINIQHPDFNKNEILRNSIQSDIVEDNEKWKLFQFKKEKPSVKINNLEIKILDNCCNQYFIIIQKNIYN
ncbi:Dynamin, partial [Spraguea lophii 42_110]